MRHWTAWWRGTSRWSFPRRGLPPTCASASPGIWAVARSRWTGRLSKEYCERVLGIGAERIVTGAMAADSELLAARCNALRPEQLEAKRRASGTAGRPLFLYMGQLIPRKGVRELLAGWERYTRGGG